MFSAAFSPGRHNNSKHGVSATISTLDRFNDRGRAEPSSMQRRRSALVEIRRDFG